MYRLIEQLVSGQPSIEGRLGLFGRTAADDLRAAGFPAGDAPAGGSGRTATDEDEDGSADDQREDVIEDTDDVPDPDDDEGNTGKAKAKAESEELDSYGETDDTDPNYEKRFKGSQKSYLEQKRRNDELEARLEAIESLPVQQVDSHAVAANAGDETAARLQAELDQIDPKDKDARAKTIQKWVGTIQTTGAQAGEQAAIRVLAGQEAREEAVRKAKAALVERKLDPEKYFPKMDEKAAYLKATNPNWFKQIPASKQFGALADLVMADRNEILAEKTRAANEANRRTAGGVVSNNSTINKTSSKTKDDVPDRSFTQQMRDAQRVRVADGMKRTQMAQSGR